MEYLDGLTLGRLVKQYGAQPEGRVISILAAGLRLARRSARHQPGASRHQTANVFLTQRGGVTDFVKVLDFGLVKVRDPQGAAELTMAEATLGTPLYMSPEAVEHSKRGGCAQRPLLAGGGGLFPRHRRGDVRLSHTGEVLMHQVKDLPVRPSERLGKPVVPDLEELLMRCLAKIPRRVRANARELDDAPGPLPERGGLDARAGRRVVAQICRNAKREKPW